MVKNDFRDTLAGAFDSPCSPTSRLATSTLADTMPLSATSGGFVYTLRTALEI